jgi:putative membrane protein
MYPYHWIIMVVFGVLVLAAIVYAIRRQSGGQNNRDLRETPLDILKARYARGEISREDFERMRKDLE